jgi:hypothetical protein
MHKTMWARTHATSSKGRVSERACMHHLKDLQTLAPLDGSPTHACIARRHFELWR